MALAPADRRRDGGRLAGRRASGRQIDRRLLFGPALAGVALVAAIMAAIGPAHAKRATYAWPPAAVSGAPQLGWYAPLELLNRVPDRLVVSLPCRLSPLLGRDGTVVATTRTGVAPALRITLASRTIRFAAGGIERASIPWPAGCPTTVDVSDGALHVGGRTVPLALRTLHGMPVVTGLFTSLDLRRGEPPRVKLTTLPFDTCFTSRQIAAAVAAVIFALAALSLVARFRLRRRWRAPDLTDLVVVGTLVVWWIVAPVFTDDGWVWAESRQLRSVGGVSVLYDVWGLVAPIGYWVQQLIRPIVGSTSDLVVMRIPALLALLVAWPLCRWCLHVAVRGRPGPVVRWVLPGAFLVNSIAWGMTVRPEPLVSLIVLVALAGALAFVRQPRAGTFAVAVVAVVLAVTAHPAGVVAMAPVLATAPAITRWLVCGGRAAAASFGAVVVSAVSLGLVLFVLDGDLATRLDEARVFGEADRHRQPPWHEYMRYQLFDQFGGADTGRRLSLALLILVGFAWALRPRRRALTVLAEPARAVAIGLGLLAFVSSKWPWHFGTLAAIGAVAAATESARIELADTSQFRAVVAAGAVVGAAIYAWLAPDGWSPLDLQELEWGDVFNGWTLATFLLVGACTAAVALWRYPTAVRRVAGWSVATVCLVVVGMTAAMLALDAAKSPWTPARQNLTVLAGRTSCGLADQLEGGADLPKRLASEPTLIAPAIAPYLPCARLAGIRGGVLETPLYFAWQGAPWPITEPDGPYAAVQDLYALHPIARWPRGVRIKAVDQRVVGYLRLDAQRVG